MSLKNVDVQTAYRLQSDDGYIYVDVRSVPEYESGHAKGADNVPLLHLDAATRQMRPYPRGTKLLIGCQMGGRSTQASQLLLSAGYEDVTNVQGGFGGARDPRTGQLIAEGWVDAGLPVEGEESPKNG